MPRTSGTYTLPPSYKATSGQTVKVEQHNPPLEDIAQALTDSLPRDGTAPMVGNLPMNGKRITGLAAATADSDAVRKDQITPFNAYLASVAGLTMAADKLVYATGVSTAALTSFTSFARTFVGSGSASDARSALGLGTAATADLPNNSDLSVSGSSAARRDNVKAYVDAEVFRKGIPDAVFGEERTTGNNGTSLTPGSWTTLTINYASRNVSSAVTIASNRFTPDENGWVEWDAPGTGAFQTRLQNITDGTTVELGGSVYTTGGGGNSRGGAAVTAGKAYEIQQNSNGTASGIAANRGGNERYLFVQYWRT